MQLRYGMNPPQCPATVVPVRLGDQPVRVRHGEPSYINLLDALSGWQLVRDAAGALGRPAAASFKHLSPAGAAIAGAIDGVMAESYGIEARAVGPLTSAYVKGARRRREVLLRVRRAPGWRSCQGVRRAATAFTS